MKNIRKFFAVCVVTGVCFLTDHAAAQTRKTLVPQTSRETILFPPEAAGPEKANPLPYTNGFETEAEMATVRFTEGADRTTEYKNSGDYAFKLPSVTGDTDYVLEIPDIEVENGSTYEILFSVTSDGMSGTFQVFFNDRPDDTEIEPSSYYGWETYTLTYTASSAQPLNISFKFNEENANAYIDDISVTKKTAAGVPQSLSFTEITAAPDGKTTARLGITIPELDMDGNPLAELSGIIVEYSDRQYFSDLGDPSFVDTIKQELAIGETKVYELPLLSDPGSYYFRIRAFNPHGNSEWTEYTGDKTYTVLSPFIGTDRINPELSADAVFNPDRSIVLYWKRAISQNGGFLGTVRYTLYDLQGNKLAGPTTDTFCTISTTAPGLYQYLLEAENSRGTADAKIYSASGFSSNNTLIHNVASNGSTEARVLYAESGSKETSAFSQAIYPATGVPAYIDTLVLFIKPAENGRGKLFAKIYMGTTDKEKYEGSEWIMKEDFIEKEEQTLVFSDTLAWGPNSQLLKLPLKGFWYSGKRNLVVTFLKPMQAGSANQAEFFIGAESENYTFKYLKKSSDFWNVDETPLNDGYELSMAKRAPAMVALPLGHTDTIRFFISERTDENVMVSDAEITIRQENGTLRTELKTDANGEAEFCYLPRGTFNVSIRKAGYLDTAFSFSIDETTRQAIVARFSMLNAGRIILSGTVEDEGGNPLANVTINASGLTEFNTVSDEEGVFRIEQIYGRDAYTLSFERKDLQPFSLAIELGNKDSVLKTPIRMAYIPRPVSTAFATDDKTLTVGWHEPATSLQLSWSKNDEDMRRFSLDGKSAFKYAQSFLPEDIKPARLARPEALRIGFVPGSVTAQYSLVLCQDTTKEIFRQKIESRELTEGQWYYLHLSEGIAIDTMKELWVIVEVAESPNQGFAATMSASGKIEGQGNLIAYNNVWRTLSEISGGTANGNFLIRLIAEDAATSTPPKNGYRIYRGLAGQSFDRFVELTEEPVRTRDYIDTEYARLDPGQYRYAVVTDWYADNRSEPVYTQSVYKDMFMNVDFEITAADQKAAGATASLSGSERLYTATADHNGKIRLNNVKRGSYAIDATFPYFHPYTDSLFLSSDTVLKIALEEVIVDPVILSAVAAGRNVTVTWGINTSNWTDNVESYTDFAIDNIGPWLMGEPVLKGQMQLDEYTLFTWPNVDVPQNFIVYNDSKVMPEPMYWEPYSGMKCFLALFTDNGSANNDYLIRPVEKGGGTFGFHVKGGSPMPETFHVVYSSASSELSDFHPVADGENLQTGTSWEERSFAIPEEAKFIGIRYTSEDVYGLMIDDLFYMTEPTADPTGYEIYADGGLVQTVNGQMTTWTFEDMEPGTHEIGIKALYRSASSAMATIEVTVSDHPSPIDLSVETEGADAVLTWKAPTGHTPESYKVYLDNVLKATDITGLSHTFKGLTEGSYTASVVAVYPTGESAKTSVKFKIEDVGTESRHRPAEARLFPNPSDGTFSICIPEPCLIEVYGMNGTKVLSLPAPLPGTYTCRLEDRAKGVYMIRLTADRETVVLKVVIR